MYIYDSLRVAQAKFIHEKHKGDKVEKTGTDKTLLWHWHIIEMGMAVQGPDKEPKHLYLPDEYEIEGSLIHKI